MCRSPSFSLFESAKDSCQRFFISRSWDLQFFFYRFCEVQSKVIAIGFSNLSHNFGISDSFLQALSLRVRVASLYYTQLAGYSIDIYILYRTFEWLFLLFGRIDIVGTDLCCFIGQPETWAAIVCRVPRCEEGANRVFPFCLENIFLELEVLMGCLKMDRM